VVDTLASFEGFFSNPPAAPTRFDYRSIEPDFDIYGWEVATDRGRALEFMRIGVNGRSLTLEGSGRTAITTPPRYQGLKLVDAGGKPRQPGSDGRLRFVVDLGRANTVQQYTPGSATTMRRRTVTLNPHAVIRITRSAWRAGRLTVCASTIGGAVPRALIKAAGQVSAISLSRTPACRNIAVRPRPARVSISGNDRFGHPVSTSARLR
jgi:hypothetical protein